jgi:hypothetical protein
MMSFSERSASALSLSRSVQSTRTAYHARQFTRSNETLHAGSGVGEKIHRQGGRVRQAAEPS